MCKVLESILIKHKLMNSNNLEEFILLPKSVILFKNVKTNMIDHCRSSPLPLHTFPSYLIPLAHVVDLKSINFNRSFIKSWTRNIFLKLQQCSFKLPNYFCMQNSFETRGTSFLGLLILKNFTGNLFCFILYVPTLC